MCRNEGPRVNSQAARKSKYNHRGKSSLRRIAGKNEANPFIGLLKGIKTLKYKVSQLCSKVKNDK